MRVSRAAKRYSKASLEFAIEKNVSNDVMNDFKNILNVISNSLQLNQFLSNPVISSNLKSIILFKIFPYLSEKTRSIIYLLSKNRRLSILDQVAKDFIFRLKKSKGKITATVTSAVPLNENLKTFISLKANQMTELEVEIDNKIDSSIIGGFIINIGDKELNASISNQIESLKKRLISNRNSS